METRQRIVEHYEDVKASLEKELQHLKEVPIEKFVWAILSHINKKENPKLLGQEFLAWGYAKNLFYPKSTGNKYLWHLCVFLDWDKTARKDHDMNNHMSISGKKDVHAKDIKDAERHALELLGDYPDAISDEAKEEIGIYINRPAT